MKTEKSKKNELEPTEAFKKEFYFENERDEQMGIETAIYANGNSVKRYSLSDGRVAVVRELLGSDMANIEKSLMGENNDAKREEKLKDAVYHYSVKLDGQSLPMEDFSKLKMKDYLRIKVMAESLNF
jgi:hypothetical protein